MIAGLRTRELVVIGATVAAGLGGTLVALGGRTADAQFVLDQRHPPKLQGTEVARVVRTAPDPATGKGAGTAATCASKGKGPLGNPWACSVRYPSGKRVRLTVSVFPDGTYDGRYRGGGGAQGCCVNVPGTH